MRGGFVVGVSGRRFTGSEPLQSYYYLMGWDPETGVPTRLTLERLLGLDWVAEDLARHGKLPG